MVRVKRAGALLSGALLAGATVVTGSAPAFASATPAGQLEGVFCTAAANCWAVGSRDSNQATLNQILHWTGKKWFRAATLN